MNACVIRVYQTKCNNIELGRAVWPALYCWRVWEWLGRSEGRGVKGRCPEEVGGVWERCSLVHGVRKEQEIVGRDKCKLMVC